MESSSLSPFEIYLSIYMTKTNPNKESLLQAFYNLLKTDLYELTI
jgi:hypothetical protein